MRAFLAYLKMVGKDVPKVQKAGIEIEEALRMCSLYPAQLLGCDDGYGKIIPQAAGQFIVLNKQLEIVQIINYKGRTE